MEQPAGNARPANAPASVTDANAANAGFNYLVAVAMFIIAAGFIWYFQIKPIFNLNDPDFNPLIFAAAIFAAIGLYQLLKAVRDTLRVRKFGKTTLEAGPAHVGQVFEGKLRASRDLSVRGDYEIILKCIVNEQIQVRIRSKNDSGVRHIDRIVWEGRQTVSRDRIRASEGIPFSFVLPADVPPSRGPTIHLDEEGTRWILTITAPMRGMDYYAIFAIDVSDLDT